MDYKLHYDRLIEKARNRVIDGYVERHHVIPKCMGGDDSIDNLVILTAEEHFVAHLLLVKIYPDNEKLVFAANMMCVNDSNQARHNKEYAWLKKKRSALLSEKMLNNTYSKGSIRSDDFKDNLSKLYKGVKKEPFSNEHKKNLSKAIKEAYAKKTPEERKKAPRTQEHIDNWKKAMQKRKELRNE